MKLKIQNMIWEIDESGTGQISLGDLKLMYHKCRFDDTGLEPKTLYYIILFIMYSLTTTSDKSNNTDEDMSGHAIIPQKVIKPVPTYELIFLRQPDHPAVLPHRVGQVQFGHRPVGAEHAPAGAEHPQAVVDVRPEVGMLKELRKILPSHLLI